MKKVLSVIAVALLALGLVACSNEGTTLNEHNIGIAKATVALVDAYFDGDITAKEAGGQISTLYDDIDKDEAGGVGFASIDRSFLQETLKKLAGELQGGADEELVMEYRDKIAGLAKL